MPTILKQTQLKRAALTPPATALKRQEYLGRGRRCPSFPTTERVLPGAFLHHWNPEDIGRHGYGAAYDPLIPIDISAGDGGLRNIAHVPFQTNFHRQRNRAHDRNPETPSGARSGIKSEHENRASSTSCDTDEESW